MYVSWPCSDRRDVLKLLAQRAEADVHHPVVANLGDDVHGDVADLTWAELVRTSVLVVADWYLADTTAYRRVCGRCRFLLRLVGPLSQVDDIGGVLHVGSKSYG
jgi:hypothetical protein